MIFTLSPTCHGDAVASLITRLEPSSKRTVMSKLLVVLTSFSISLPRRPPATAPTTAPILRLSPSPTWWPTTPPTTAPPTAPAPLPLPLVSTSCTDCTTPQSRQIAACCAFGAGAACGRSGERVLSTLLMGLGSALPLPIQPIMAATPAPQNKMKTTPATQRSGCKVFPACVSITDPLVYFVLIKTAPLARGVEVAGRASFTSRAC